MGILHLPAAESFLIGAVLSSTDAASVFAILRKKKLNLKSGTASILEVESGSNDPIAYLLTIIAISMIGVGESIPLGATIVKQILFGVLMGIIQARITLTVLTKTKLIAEGLDTIFIIAVVMLCYGLTSAVGGNAYLSVYLFGIIIGNSKMQNKQTLIPFFDGVTSLAQILIFFFNRAAGLSASNAGGHSASVCNCCVFNIDCKTRSSFFAASAVSLQHPPMPVNFMGRSARRFFVGVCNYGGCKRH